MRWIWIDKFVAFESGRSARAVKNISLAEEHLHDLYPAWPMMPASLIVEGMAQTAGILVGEARNFREKVILAKIGKAVFHHVARPGMTLLYDATLEQLNETGASVRGVVTARDAADPMLEIRLAEIELMFSHVDQNLAGVKFPEHNFVFTEQFVELLRSFR